MVLQDLAKEIATHVWGGSLEVGKARVAGLLSEPLQRIGPFSEMVLAGAHMI